VPPRGALARVWVGASPPVQRLLPDLASNPILNCQLSPRQRPTEMERSEERYSLPVAP